MEELRRENERLRQENQELRELLKQVTERLMVAEQIIKQLREQLQQNSDNSNWPSSRDKSRQKPKPQSLRSKTERKAGGQEGHEGHSLVFNPEPEIIEKHRPTQCEHCQASLAEELEASNVSKRQLLDLPPLRYVTTEHQVETVRYPNCGEATSGEFPVRDLTAIIENDQQ